MPTRALATVRTVGAFTASRAVAPAAAAAAALAAFAVVAVVDPNAPGHYPTCPFLALTGYDCPGCGSLRAMHALSRGDLAAALDRNLLTVALLPVVVLLWWRWAQRSWTGVDRRRRAVRPALLYALVVVVVVFWVVRNLPFASYLAA